MPTLQHAQFVALIVLCFYKSVTQAQVVGRGDSCPQLTAVSNFDLAKYVGKWYENRKYISDYQVGQMCVTLNLDKINNNAVSIKSDGVRKLTKFNTTISGTASLADPTVGRFTANFTQNALAVDNTPYLVLGTDYTSYSVIWSCTTRGPFYYLHTLWIHTRDLLPSQFTIDQALEVARKNNLNLGKLRVTNQKNCRT